MQSDFVERPVGTRDYVGCELTRKRAVEDRLIREFEQWGYQSVETPLFEYAETIARGLHRDEDERLFRLFDREGRTIALRPEMTTPVARVATTLLAAETLPLRICYCAKTYSGRSGRAQEPVEVTQAGVELIGDSGPDADAEIIALMAGGLRAVGLTEFRFALGHMGFVQSLFSVLAPGLRTRLRRALIAKDLVAYDATLAGEVQSLPADWLESLRIMPRIRGGKDAIEQARSIAFVEAAQRACDEWQELLTALSDHGVEDVVHLDLGLCLDHEYYTGITIEGYADALGQPIAFGGRYDALLAQFGNQAAATGCVVHVERVLAALGESSCGDPVRRLYYGANTRRLALAVGRELRRLEHRVAVAGVAPESEAGASAVGAVTGSGTGRSVAGFAPESETGGSTIADAAGAMNRGPWAMLANDGAVTASDEDFAALCRDIVRVLAPGGDLSC